jgi:hypothetical protein
VGVCNLILQKVHQSIHHQNLFRLKIQIFWLAALWNRVGNPTIRYRRLWPWPLN